MKWSTNLSLVCMTVSFYCPVWNDENDEKVLLKYSSQANIG